MKFLFIYLLGLALCGVIESILFQYQSYSDYFEEKVDEAKSQLPEQGVEFIDYDAIVTWEIIVTSLFSWLGIIYIILQYIDYIVWLKKHD